jgi:hypothetical protein
MANLVQNLLNESAQTAFSDQHGVAQRLSKKWQKSGLLEGLHADEVALMLAIKDQTLHKLYPKLTRKWAESVNLIPKAEPTTPKKTPVKSV